MDNEKNPEIKEDTPQEEREDELGEELDEGSEEELDLDEDGNIMIPDEEEEAEEEPEDEPEEEEEPEEDAEEEPSGEEDAEDHAAEPPAEDPEKATLRAEKDEATRKYDALLAQARETLKKLGHNADDPLAALVQIAAESEGKSELIVTVGTGVGVNYHFFDPVGFNIGNYFFGCHIYLLRFFLF